MQRKETNFAEEEKIYQKQRVAFAGRSSFSPGRGCRKAMWTEVCPNKGWSRWPEILSNSNSYQGFISWGFVVLHHLLQTFNFYKGVRIQGLLCFSARKLAKSKQQVTENYCGMFSYLPSSEPLRLLDILREK